MVPLKGFTFISFFPFLAPLLSHLLTWILTLIFVPQNIHVTAWGPLTIDRATQYNVSADPAAQQIAQSIGLTPAQLMLSWAVQRGTSVIPKSSNRERLRENMKSMFLHFEFVCCVRGVLLWVFFSILFYISFLLLFLLTSFGFFFSVLYSRGTLARDHSSGQ